MNADIKTQWVEALRSGKYKQGKRELRSQDECYCCLGVLCDVVRPDTWVKYSSGYASKIGVVNRFGYLHNEIAKPIGVSDDDQDKLIQLNDKEGKSFDEIAAYIEKEL